jgi:hypothetical protein
MLNPDSSHRYTPSAITDSVQLLQSAVFSDVSSAAVADLMQAPLTRSLPRWYVAARSGLLASVLALGMAVAGCGEEPPPPAVQLLPAPLSVQRIDWSATPTAPARITAIAESGDDTALYSDQSITLYSSGELFGSDPSVRGWQSAAAVPSLGFPGTWLLGADGQGRLHRLRFGPTLQLSVEEVSGRYQLVGKPVQQVVSAGGSQVAFVLADKVAVTDGMSIKQYDFAGRGLVAAQGRLAALDDAGVQLLDLSTQSLRRLSASGLLAVAFASDGKLWAVSSQTLYREEGSALLPMYQALEGQTLTGIVASARGVWVSFGDGFGLVRGEQLLQATAAQAGLSGPLPAGTRLQGSSSGDLWVMSDSELTRLGEPSGGGADLVLWRKHLQPIFHRLCQGCHLPGGSAHIDMSTYSGWAQLRAQVAQRVVAMQPSPMPPAGGGKLTAEELAVVAAWAARSL